MEGDAVDHLRSAGLARDDLGGEGGGHRQREYQDRQEQPPRAVLGELRLRRHDHLAFEIKNVW